MSLSHEVSEDSRKFWERWNSRRLHWGQHTNHSTSGWLSWPKEEKDPGTQRIDLQSVIWQITYNGNHTLEMERSDGCYSSRVIKINITNSEMTWYCMLSDECKIWSLHIIYLIFLPKIFNLNVIIRKHSINLKWGRFRRAKKKPIKGKNKKGRELALKTNNGNNK